MVKKFHLRDILSVTTRRALDSNGGIDGVKKLLDFMTCKNLLTFELPEAAKQCDPYLLEQLPFLKEIDASEITSKNYYEWTMDKVNKYGAFHNLTQIPKEY